MTETKLLEPSMADVLKAIEVANDLSPTQEDALVVFGTPNLHWDWSTAGKHPGPLVGRERRPPTASPRAGRLQSEDACPTTRPM